jgi:hypothetical protein
MGAISVLNFSRNTHTITLALNGRSENTIYLALLKLKSSSDVSSSEIFTLVIL